MAMKDVGLRIRIDRDLREQFLKACQADDKPAAQVLREFMRAYVAERGADSAITHGGGKAADQPRLAISRAMTDYRRMLPYIRRI